jgi:hypothetical protein
MQTPKVSPKKNTPTELITEFNKVTEYKVNEKLANSL